MIDINREEIASQVSLPLTSFVSATNAPIEAATWQRILQLLYNVSVDGKSVTRKKMKDQNETKAMETKGREKKSNVLYDHFSLYTPFFSFQLVLV